MTTTILRDHALRNIWAEPLQDHQHRIKPARISPESGFYGEAKVMWERIPLPDYGNGQKPKGFHVYPIGQLPLIKFTLERMVAQRWYSALEIVSEFDTVIDLYADNGCVVPRDNVFLYLNYDNNLIMAVLRNGADLGTIEVRTPYDEVMEIPYSLDDHGVTLRFYNNAIANLLEWEIVADQPEQPLSDVVVKINQPSDFTNFTMMVAAVEAKYPTRGKGIYYHNGFLVSKPKGFDNQYIGSTWSFQYDETVKELRFFNLRDAPGFQSIIDPNKKKYLLLSRSNAGLLDYFDDCDYYLITRNEIDETYRGVAIDPYNHTAIRQVTHDAWALTEDSVNLLTSQHKFFPSREHLTVMVKVRQGGMIRGIGQQVNRVEELYHLSHEQRLEAMAGIDSTMPEWRAANLENSAYIRLMGSKFTEITDELVEDSYGYNGATYAVAKSIYAIDEKRQITIDDGRNIPWDIRKPNPQAQMAKRVLFWYDVDGLYLGNTISNGTFAKVELPVQFPTAHRVEVFNGELVAGVGDVGTWPDLPKVYDYSYGYYGYRNYVCGLVNGGLDHNWIDVTDSPFCKYVIPKDGSTPYVEWQYDLLNQVGYYPATRFGDKINVHTPVFKSDTFSGVLEYSINKIQDSKLSLLGVPPGFFTIYMDGISLIENLDYYYVKGGLIRIVRAPNQSVNDTRFVIRFHGFMNPETRRPFAPRDVGFVKNGILSANRIYNPWHDRDIRITVNGKLRLAKEVQFAEAGSGNAGQLYLDGMAYSVEDYQSLVEPFTGKLSVPYKMESMAIDQRVSDYLTPRLPENDPDYEYIKPARHELYSPIMARFIQLMLLGAISDADAGSELLDETILTRYGYIAKEYQDQDPILVGYDANYVSIRPHPHRHIVEVTANQYALLERVNRIFLKTALDLTRAVKIKL